MTTSRLKFELIDGCESTGQPRPRDLRRPPDMTTNQQFSDQVDWSRQSDTLRRSIVPSVLDPSLLHDLAEGLEFLHRQLDDSESDLERSHERSLAFEQDARRWEQEAARLREDASSTRRSLDQLRLEFEHSREGALEQHQTVERIAAELAELRAARAHLEELAAEQQRALVLSLELLKRVNGAEPNDQSAAIAEKDREIAGLKRLIEAAGEEGTRIGNELAVAQALTSAGAEQDLAVDQASRQALESAQAEIDTLRSELAGAQVDLESSRTELGLARAAFAADRKAFESLKPVEGMEASADQNSVEERARINQKLLDAEAEIALQNAEVDSRGAVIIALESALEEQNASLRTLEERFLAYAEQVQSLQLERLEMPVRGAKGIAQRIANAFSPPKRRRPRD